jgi:hypothetical protein
MHDTRENQTLRSNSGKAVSLNMEKREFDRNPLFLEVHCLNKEYFGTVLNLSEKGMFIKSHKIDFPFLMQFELYVTLIDKTFKVPVRVNRVTKSNGYYDGIGVEVLDPPADYLEFVDSLKSFCKSY